MGFRLLRAGSGVLQARRDLGIEQRLEELGLPRRPGCPSTGAPLYRQAQRRRPSVLVAWLVSAAPQARPCLPVLLRLGCGSLRLEGRGA